LYDCLLSSEDVLETYRLLSPCFAGVSDLEILSLLFEKEFSEGTYPANLLGGVSDLEILSPLFEKEFSEGTYAPQGDTKQSPTLFSGINEIKLTTLQPRRSQ
jgi:hypothetical protein